MSPYRRLAPGDTIPVAELIPMSGPPVTLTGHDGLVHVQFRRFAGCPVCNLHLRSVAARHAEIETAGVREVVVFHSTAEDLAEHVDGLPFAVVADPEKRLYRAFCVESSRRALLDPRAWGPVLAGLARSAVAVIRGREPSPSLMPRGGRYGLPADLLIAGDGRVLAAKYGEHAYDQWQVDELLRLAAQDNAEAVRR